MSQQLPRTPLHRPSEPQGIIANQYCTPYSKGIASTSHLNDLRYAWPGPSGILTHAPCYVGRRTKTAQWLVDDVSKTANASALAMLAVFTQRIMPPNSRKHPKDILECILNEIRNVCWVANANPEGVSSTGKPTKQQWAKNEGRHQRSNQLCNDLPTDENATVDSINSIAMKVEKMKQAHSEL